jgi:phosphate starvation-inducible membrane PsiE
LKHRTRKSLALEAAFAYSPITMSDDKPGEGARQKPWTSHAAKLLGTSESVILVLIAVALVLVAVLLLYSSLYDLNEAVHHGEIESKAIQILNTVLLVMMTMEIVYTVAISLESHTLNAEPFMIIGVIAAIRRMLVITATSTQLEAQTGQFHNMLLELGLLAATVIALASAIWILRYSAQRYVKEKHVESE